MRILILIVVALQLLACEGLQNRLIEHVAAGGQSIDPMARFDADSVSVAC